MNDEQLEANSPVDEVFDDVAEPVAETVTAEPAQEQAAEPTGEQLQGNPAPDASPASEESQERNVPFSAYEAERQKRQELEQRLQQQQAPEPEPQGAGDDVWWEDPANAAQSLEQKLSQQMQVGLYQTRLGMNEAQMRSQYEDYDQVVESVVQAAQADPSGPLAMQLFTHATPATHAYQLGQQMKMIAEVGQDPAAYEAKIREKILAEMQGGTAQNPTSKAQAPTSLAAIPSAAPAAGPGPDSYTPLDELLPD